MFGFLRYRKQKESKNGERKVKKMNDLYVENSSSSSVEMNNGELEKIMNKLLAISDVSGAGIVKMDGSVISWQMEDVTDPTQYVDFMMDFLSFSKGNNVDNYKHGMFTQKIVDYNGHKILMSKVKADMMLMLLLDKKAYLGLTMLDMEGFLREIDLVLDQCCT
jgi:predicted regulator of Ras-like GTPase activity (Roadblock/LC7/MglB family)